jgi:hypothetical protein
LSAGAALITVGGAPKQNTVVVLPRSARKQFPQVRFGMTVTISSP